MYMSLLDVPCGCVGGRVEDGFSLTATDTILTKAAAAAATAINTRNKTKRTIKIKQKYGWMAGGSRDTGTGWFQKASGTKRARMRYAYVTSCLLCFLIIIITAKQQKVCHSLEMCCVSFHSKMPQDMESEKCILFHFILFRRRMRHTQLTWIQMVWPWNGLSLSLILSHTCPSPHRRIEECRIKQASHLSDSPFG